jgi:hypothetical protein
MYNNDVCKGESLKNILEPTLGLSTSFFLSHCWRDESKDDAKEFVSMLEDVSRDLVWYDEKQLDRVNHFPSKMQQGGAGRDHHHLFVKSVPLEAKKLFRTTMGVGAAPAQREKPDCAAS